MSKAFFGCIRTALSTEANTEFQTNQALARRQEELDDYGRSGYVLTSTLSVPAADRVTIGRHHAADRRGLIMRRCIMCDEPNPMYIPDDVVDDYGTYSCGNCGFEMECARELPAPPVTAIPLIPAEILLPLPHVDDPALAHTPPALLLAGSNHG